MLFCNQWFEQFPEFLSNPFYITGESFAGIYVPTLASQVVQGNILAFIDSKQAYWIYGHNFLLVILILLYNM